MGGGGWGMLRSMRREEEIRNRKIGRATAKRVLGFARPYRRDILIFLVAVVLDAVIGVAGPVLAGRAVNTITGHQPGAASAVVRIALLIAVLALADALLSLVNRWYSARIGEGIILTLRTKVYDHVQRMPLQFFTRTQTGALVSRLNNDVLGAQQAFTSTLSGVVSNVIQLVLTAAVMFTLSWQVTALSLFLLPIFILPARRVGRKLAEITRESYQLDAKMNATMTERFGVAGALLVKLFGRPEDEARRFADRARRVRDIGIQQAMYGRIFFVAMILVAALATALTYGLGGWFAVRGEISAGTVVTLALLLPRVYDVTDGVVLVGGVDVRETSLADLRDVIGVVTQDAHLFHETIADNLRYARPDATDEELWAALTGAQIADLVRALPDGLDTVVGERGYRFSGGEKQRIAIARLLLKAPSIVILDEATAHLDSESEAAVQRALSVALEGRTALVIAHRLSTIREADEILVMDGGRIVERGTHDELVAAGGLYAELYRTQFATSDSPLPGSPGSADRLLDEVEHRPEAVGRLSGGQP